MNPKASREDFSKSLRIATWLMAGATGLLVWFGSVFAFFPGFVGLFFWQAWSDNDKAIAKKGNKA